MSSDIPDKMLVSKHHPDIINDILSFSKYHIKCYPVFDVVNTPNYSPAHMHTCSLGHLIHQFSCAPALLVSLDARFARSPASPFRLFTCTLISPVHLYAYFACSPTRLLLSFTCTATLPVHLHAYFARSPTHLLRSFTCTPTFPFDLYACLARSPANANQSDAANFRLFSIRSERVFCDETTFSYITPKLTSV